MRRINNQLCIAQYKFRDLAARVDWFPPLRLNAAGWVGEYIKRSRKRDWHRRHWAQFSPETKLEKSRAKRSRAKSRGRAWLTRRPDKNKPERILAHRFRRRLSNMLDGNYWGKTKPMEFLGCSITFFKSYIEQRFKPGMTWGNRELWDIDHIIPCAKHDLSKKAQVKACFHYTNMRPEWRTRNRGRRDRLEEEQTLLAV